MNAKHQIIRIPIFTIVAQQSMVTKHGCNSGYISGLLKYTFQQQGHRQSTANPAASGRSHMWVKTVPGAIRQQQQEQSG
jgi:hypothetical protein